VESCTRASSRPPLATPWCHTFHATWLLPCHEASPAHGPHLLIHQPWPPDHRGDGEPSSRVKQGSAGGAWCLLALRDGRGAGQRSLACSLGKDIHSNTKGCRHQARRAQETEDILLRTCRALCGSPIFNITLCGSRTSSSAFINKITITVLGLSSEIFQVKRQLQKREA